MGEERAGGSPADPSLWECIIWRRWEELSSRAKKDELKLILFYRTVVRGESDREAFLSVRHYPSPDAALQKSPDDNLG